MREHTQKSAFSSLAGGNAPYRAKKFSTLTVNELTLLPASQHNSCMSAEQMQPLCGTTSPTKETAPTGSLTTNTLHDKSGRVGVAVGGKYCKINSPRSSHCRWKSVVAVDFCRSRLWACCFSAWTLCRPPCQALWCPRFHTLSLCSPGSFVPAVDVSSPKKTQPKYFVKRLHFVLSI